MSGAWTADFELTPEMALSLLNCQFPELEIKRMELIGVGWDNSAFLVNGNLVFRFPRRRLAADLINIERHVLPLLAPCMPLPIPVPVYRGEPTAEYPYPFSGHVRVPGRSASDVEMPDQVRAKLAAPLARLLKSLHDSPVAADIRAWAPGDVIGRTNLRRRLKLIRDRFEKPGASISFAGFDRAQVTRLAELLAETPPAFSPSCWVHGDLYARHLMVDDQAELCGIIDWGDVHLGDAALDLSISFSFLPQSAHSAFREAYGDIDADTWRRARFRALNYGVILVDYGTEVGDDALLAAGQYALKSAMNPCE